MNVLYTIAVVISILFLIIYYISRWKFNYWQKRNVPYATPKAFTGNYGDYLLMKKYSGTVLQELCEQFPDAPYFGTFYGTEPALVVKDPELLKLVLTKDFYFFNGREVTKYIHREVVTQSMFFQYGDEWKVIRQNLTPLFSSGKMKNMFYMIEKCSHALIEMIDYESSISKVLDAKSLMARYTMDCITSCAFGIEANVMSKDQNANPFQMMAKALFNPSMVAGLKTATRLMWPGIFYALKLQWFPTTISTFFNHVLINVFQQREYKPSGRNDFVDSVLTFKQQNYIEGDSLINPRKSESKKIQMKVDDEMMVSQCVLFFAAGYETSSSALMFTLYELAKNPEVQERAREKVVEYLRKHDGKINYDCVSEIPYLDACLQETMRLYPLFGILAREVMDDYTFPSGLAVKKGMRIHIPIQYMHRDPRNFPEPMEYKPERFLTGAIDPIKPYTFLPFGEGPRMCLGVRFAKMQGLAALITILGTYRIALADGMPRTVQIDPKVYPAQPNCEIRIKLIKRDL